MTEYIKEMYKNHLRIKKEKSAKKKKEYFERRKRIRWSKVKKLLEGIKYRCGRKGYKNIKCLLSLQLLSNLMTKYEYWKMKKAGLKPNIHRINPAEDYMYGNCIFVSAEEHRKIHIKLRKGGN